MKKAFLLFCCVFCFVWGQDENDGGNNNNESFNALKELSKIQLVTANGKKVSGMPVVSKKKYVALYFSSKGCGFCRQFNPDLVNFRNYCVKKKLPFEVIFVSGDRNEGEMKTYMEEDKMPWPAIPYSSNLRQTLLKEFGVVGYPTLVLLDGSGKLFSKNVRFDVAILGAEAYKRWQSPNYKPLTYEDSKKIVTEKNNKKEKNDKKGKKSKKSKKNKEKDK